MFLDSGKLKLEGQLFELSLVKNEVQEKRSRMISLSDLTAPLQILHFLQELDGWLAPEVVSVPPPFEHWQPTIYKRPKGLCLIVA